MPANCGLFVRDRETVFRIGLRGGAGRIRTSSQFVMNLPGGSLRDASLRMNDQLCPVNCGELILDDVFQNAQLVLPLLISAGGHPASNRPLLSVRPQSNLSDAVRILTARDFFG